MLRDEITGLDGTGLKHVSELIKKESVVRDKWRTGTPKGTMDISLCNYFSEDLKVKLEKREYEHIAQVFINIRVVLATL